MKKFIKINTIIIISAVFLFGMPVALAQNTNNGTDINIDDNITNDNDGVPNYETENNFDNNNVVNEDNDDLSEIVTYGISGIAVGGILTYFIMRDKKTI